MFESVLQMQKPIYSTGSWKRSGVAVQIGGVCTIANSSDDPIFPGDMVYLDFPERFRDNGHPGAQRSLGMGNDNDHRIFRITTTKPSDDDIFALTIGMALSKAESGKPFDIRLGSYII